MLAGRRWAWPLIAAALAGCASVAFAGPGCVPTAIAVPLSPNLEESSGVAVSRRHPGVFWTHNDDGSVLHAIAATGSISASFEIRAQLRDWEDIAVAECRDGGSCLYLADLGDNQERRAAGQIQILRIVEPDTTGIGPLEAEVFPIRLPDGPRDIEALLVFPGERVHVVTKGRNHAVTVYRYLPPLRPDTVTLEEVQRLTEGSAPLGDQVTGESVAPDGAIAAIRTYQALDFYRMESDTLARLVGGRVNLRTLRESQGEAVGIGTDGLVVLTSEAGPLGGSASMNLLRCELDRL